MSKASVASLAAIFVAGLLPSSVAVAEPVPANVDELRSELTALKVEQQSTEERIEALEQRIDELAGGGTLNSETRISDADKALMRGRGVGTIDMQVPGAEDETTRTEPAKSQAVEAVTRNEQGYFGHQFSIDPGISYSHFSNAQLNLSGFLALDSIFLGTISLDQTNSDVITSDVTARYGIGRLQADVNIPYLYRRSNFRSGGAGGNASG
ncbi:MAG: hypothetical protein ACRD3W_28575, partial [Terriglobales bacterium]